MANTEEPATQPASLGPAGYGTDLIRQRSGQDPRSAEPAGSQTPTPRNPPARSAARCVVAVTVTAWARSIVQLHDDWHHATYRAMNAIAGVHDEVNARAARG